MTDSKYNFNNASDGSLVFELFDDERVRERMYDYILTGRSDALVQAAFELDDRHGSGKHQRALKEELESEYERDTQLRDYFNGRR